MSQTFNLKGFINKMAWTSAFVVKLCEGKKPFKQYLPDFLYYSLCHQAGFALTYYPFKGYKGKRLYLFKQPDNVVCLFSEANSFFFLLVNKTILR
jgi:hypothetical protein